MQNAVDGVHFICYSQGTYVSIAEVGKESLLLSLINIIQDGKVWAEKNLQAPQWYEWLIILSFLYFSDNVKVTDPN